jgi:hypothetical protein
MVLPHEISNIAEMKGLVQALAPVVNDRIQVEVNGRTTSDE